MKLITIPLHELLDYIWRPYRDHANIPMDLASTIHSLDTEEVFCHIEFPDPNAPHLADGPPKIPKLWRKKDWDTSLAKWKAQKEESERERQKSFTRQATLDKLTKALADKAHLPLDIASNVATAIYISGNKELARFYGVEEALKAEGEIIPMKIL